VGTFDERAISYSTEELIAEYKRRFILGQMRPIHDLFSQQKAFDNDTKRFKAALTTRRAGKSTLAAARLLESAYRNPGTLNCYLALTRDSARRILWPILIEMNEKYKLKAVATESNLTLKLKNKSEVFLLGADSKNFTARLRGAKYKRVVIDEAQSYSQNLQELVDDILTPALLDLNGDLDLYGSPGPRLSGYFHDVTTKPENGWSTHRWSILNNPHLPSAPEFIAEILKQKAWTVNHPTFKREWLGEWVLDESSLLFEYNPIFNTKIESMGEYETILGVDFGYRDKTAVCVLRYATKEKKAHVIESHAKAEMIISEIAVLIKDLIDKHQPTKIVADTGGLGLSMAKELSKRHHLPIHPAVKREKAARIQTINDALRTRQLTVHPENGNLIYQLMHLSRTDKGIERPDEECDEADALIYAFTEALHYLSEPESPKFALHSEDKLMESLERNAQEMQNQDWWERV